MEVGLVRSIDIDHEMQQAYLDYAMSVIVARALPDARDGLKPVHRRILYAMYDMGLRPIQPTRNPPASSVKCWASTTRTATWRSTKPWRAWRRISPCAACWWKGRATLAAWMATRRPPCATPKPAWPRRPWRCWPISARTRSISPTTSTARCTEPDVLPAAMPNLLVNGATGIAVGMSTNIPPHNLGEVVDALVYMLDNWERLDDVNIEDLMRFIQGPDFPTGGVIVQDTRRGRSDSGLRHRARQGDRAGARPHRGDQPRAQPHPRHRAALHDQQILADRAHRRAGRGKAGWKASPTCAMNPTGTACAS